ncbi:MAG: rod shape-determining protein [Victivallaceae bacterium]|nr:rod shape-determining protein [Victivallaceae bacterium]MDD4180417.1 rod shape-determining protein [Victivallaceae bacterium]
MFLRKLANMFSTDLGIDLGTANCVVFVRNRGIILSEPSVVAIAESTKEVLSVGFEAKRMVGRTPGNIRAIRPMKDGVIADFEVTEKMLRYFIQKAMKSVPWHKRLFPPRILVAVPSGITEVEKRAVKDSAKHAGAWQTVLVEEPMAAAVGVGLPVYEPCGSMIVDIGGGTTEVAVVSLSGIVESRSVRVGGDELDASISQYMKRVYNLLIGERTAERIKIDIGSAYPTKEDVEMEVKGRDFVSGLPKTIKITGGEIRVALQEPITSIIEAVRSTLERCPPELAADLIDHGIILAGGGAILSGLDKLISEETSLPVFVAEDPLNAVANGTGIMLQEIEYAFK